MNGSSERITNPFANQVVSNPLLPTNLKENLISQTADHKKTFLIDHYMIMANNSVQIIKLHCYYNTISTYIPIFLYV